MKSQAGAIAAEEWLRQKKAGVENPMITIPYVRDEDTPKRRRPSREKAASEPGVPFSCLATLKFIRERRTKKTDKKYWVYEAVADEDGEKFYPAIWSYELQEATLRLVKESKKGSLFLIEGSKVGEYWHVSDISLANMPEEVAVFDKSRIDISEGERGSFLS